MNHQLSFPELVNYDAGKLGITLPITLSTGKAQVSCTAKLDTGSSNCIFARHLGEEMGIDVESGFHLLVGTVTGNFVAYLHEVSILVASFQISGLVGFAADTQFSRNVLGRRGFIEQVSLGLVDYEGKLYLGPYGV